ncbi:BTAD domain-containing putative transcriptional regulator [Streptomyces sp. NPDC090025]|uniref:AfsR/SARP family transcriptional regulator n=1 Tax=Streptomyces sp. NPDC090025 TaxID=3365922 RepID=UPI003838679F
MTGPLIRVLGPVELRDADDRPLPVAGSKRKAALALLALSVNRTVPVGRFLDALWEGDPPPQAKAALQGHIAALRKTLAGSALRVETRPGGYALVGDPHAVDCHRFTDLSEGEPGFERLADALRLWRGPALDGLPATEELGTLANRLDQSGLSVLEAWAAAGLREGRAAAVVPHLETALAEYPLREPLAALLVRALGRCGRRADALVVYRRTARLLTDQLGMDPGPTLTEAVRTVQEEPAEDPAAPLPPAAPAAPAPLASVAPAPVPPAGTPQPVAEAAAARPSDYLVPRLLPRPLGSGFVDRPDETGWLDRFADGATRVAIVAGAAGSGKTTLVVRWANGLADRFPDGQLYGDLRGFNAAGPTDPGEVLHGFLRAMGVRETEIPERTEARSRLFRERSRGRRLLVVVDNALSGADVELLLPDGAEARAVVCSRHVLDELIVREGAEFLPVGPFTTEAARALVLRRVGAERAAEDPAAVDRLIDLCGRLPLALSIALARLATRPGWSVADIVDDLEDESDRLSGLGTPGDIGVTRELTLSRRQLPPEAARLLPLLTLHPGSGGLDALAAAALLDVPLRDGRLALGALAALHLVTEAGPGRYQIHDLVRLFAQQLLHEEVAVADRAAAVRRLSDYFLAATAAANVLVSGRDSGLHRPVADPPGLPRHRDIRDALRWLGHEGEAIRALTRRCAESGEHDRAWRLADNVTGLFFASGDYGSWQECALTGLRAAGHSADPAALPRMKCSLGFVNKEMSRLREAADLLSEAAEAVPGHDDPMHRVRALVPLAGVYRDLGEVERSLECAHTALTAAREAGDTWSEAYVLHAVCLGELGSGRPEVSLAHADRAIALLADHPAGHAKMAVMACAALSLGALGRFAEAEERWQTLIGLSGQGGNDHVRSLVETWYADLLARLGRHDEAAVRLRTAIELYRRREDGITVATLTARLDALTRAAAAQG